VCCPSSVCVCASVSVWFNCVVSYCGERTFLFYNLGPYIFDSNTRRFFWNVKHRDVEAVEYFLLPLPAPYKVSRFEVCFRFQILSSKCFRFHTNLTAFSFRFHIPNPCFMKNVSASSSSKSQMLPSSLPASFFKVLPLPQKFNRFQLPLPHP